MEKLLNKRLKNTHKGSYGRCGIIGGSLGMSGAITLASKASLRVGAGYVYTIIPKSLQEIMSIKLCESIIVSVKDNQQGHFIQDSIEEIILATKNLDALAVGMGMGQDQARRDLIARIIEQTNIPCVIDADGINCLKDNQDLLLKRNNIVITPHPGELAHFLGISIKKLEACRKYYCELVANKYQITVVLKGSETLVSTYNDKTYKNHTGNPGMATAGSGDVLSGMIAGFIGQGLSVFKASCLGVYLHGLAGDFAALEVGEYSLISSDLIDKIPAAILDYLK